MRKINNYHDLTVEKQHLQQKLSLLKRDVNNEIGEIKERFKPITNLIHLFAPSGNGSSSTGEPSKKSSLLKMGANLGIDLLVGPKLARAGWAARTILPPLLRGIASRVFGRKKA